jgi:hypothetical protein
MNALYRKRARRHVAETVGINNGDAVRNGAGSGARAAIPVNTSLREISSKIPANKHDAIAVTKGSRGWGSHRPKRPESALKKA